MDEFRVERYADFGSGEPWVARIMLGLPELVNAVPAFVATREAFANEIGEVFYALSAAFNTLRELRTLVVENAPASNIEKAYSNLYGHLWQAHKSRFQTAMNALGVNIGFLFQKNADFEKVAAKLLAKRPELADLVSSMRHDRAAFQVSLADYRNWVAHRTKHIDPAVLATFHSLDFAEQMFDNVWQAMERYVVLLVVVSIPAGLQVIEIPESQRDPARPTRYGWSVPGLA